MDLAASKLWMKRLTGCKKKGEQESLGAFSSFLCNFLIYSGNYVNVMEVALQCNGADSVLSNCVV